MRRSRDDLMRAHMRYAMASAAACGAAGAVALQGSTRNDAAWAFALLAWALIFGGLSVIALDEARKGE